MFRVHTWRLGCWIILVAEVSGILICTAAAEAETFVESPVESHSHCGTCPAGCVHCPPPAYGIANRLIDNKQACWTVRSDAMLLWRNSPRQRPLFDNQTTGTTALNSNQLQSSPTAGPRFSLFRTNGCGDAFEATYFFAGDWFSQRALPNLNGGYATSPPGIYGNQSIDLDAGKVTLGSSIESFEANGRLNVSPSIQLLSGFRWVEWNENMQLTESYSNPIPGTDIFTNDCINSLYGWQLGFDSLLLKTGFGLTVEGILKGGAYYNNARQESTYKTGASSNGIRIDRPHAASFVGEVGMTGIWAINRNWDFRFGYIVFWLEGLAQPTNQLSHQQIPSFGSATGSLDTTGGTVVQGLTLGLEARW